METEIPLFIKLRGCINCGVSKNHKEKTGYDYGFHHELVAACTVSGCISHGHAIYNPFIDPEEIIRKARETENRKYIENAKKYVRSIKEKFGKFYKIIGINLENFLKD